MSPKSVRRLPQGVRLALKRSWCWLRRATGDDAYERYLAHHASRHAGEAVMSRAVFYEDSQRRKWSGVSRCC
jgi:uncharacterized short protein YbdD (DUF466 family)